MHADARKNERCSRPALRRPEASAAHCIIPSVLQERGKNANSCTGVGGIWASPETVTLLSAGVFAYRVPGVRLRHWNGLKERFVMVARLVLHVAAGAAVAAAGMLV